MNFLCAVCFLIIKTKSAGYLFNIQFLRSLFGPQFILHGLRRTGDYEITSRWTMKMQLQVRQPLFIMII